MTKRNHKYTRFHYALAALSFVPIVGLFLAPIVIVWGLVAYKKGSKSLIYVGLCGLLVNLTFAVYLPLFGQHQRDALHDDKHVKHLLPEVVESIEAFKAYEGAYPKTLKVFSGETRNTGGVRLSKDIIGRLHYEVLEGGNNYFLLGIGADHSPFTADDILPSFDESSSEKNGLIFKNRSN